LPLLLPLPLSVLRRHSERSEEPLYLLLPLSVLAVILNAAKDPDTLNITQAAKTIFNHEPVVALTVAPLHRHCGSLFPQKTLSSPQPT
jgi:hypothetical protein